MSWFFTPKHKAEKDKAILKRIDHTLSRQGLPSSVLHFLVFIILEWQWITVAPTPVGSYGFGVLLVIMACWRFIMIAQFAEWYGRGPARWRDWFIASGFLHAGVWSVYLVYRLNGPEHPIAILGLLYTLAVAAGGTFVYSLYGKVVRWYLAILLLPLAFHYGVLSDVSSHLYHGIAFVALFLYLISTAGRISELVWGFLIQNFELKQRLHSLENTREAGLVEASSNRRFIQQLLHRVKNPLGGLLGVLGMLSHEEQSSEQKSMLNIAQRSGHSILDLVNDLEAFIEQRDQARVPQTSVFNLRKTLEHTLTGLGAKAHEHNLELAYLYHPDVPERIESDPQWLSNAFRRMLDFAIDSAEEGEVTVRVAPDKSSDTERLLLSFYFSEEESSVNDLNAAIYRNLDTLPEDEDVSDQLTLMVAAAQFRAMGAQLSASEDGTLKKIRVSLPLTASSQQASTFKPARLMSGRSVWLVDMTPINNRALQAEFESWEMQVTSTTLEQLTQADLGTLPDVILVNVPVEDARAEEHVRSLANWMASDALIKERLFVYASQLQRSLLSALTDNFHFIEKPVARDELLNVLTSVQRQSADETHDQNWDASRILVAEDNLVNQKVLVKLFERLGATVDTCANGQEAVQMATSDRDYDLVIMDCLMPRMDGLEATRLIRQSELGTGKHMPIIALTGEDTPEQERACLAAGMDDFMVKPVSYENLVTLMQRWLGNKESPS